MAATVSIKECNGSGPTATTVTAARLCTSDTYNPGTNYSLVKPASSYNYSYWKSFYLNADSTPATAISNVKWWTDGTIGWTGVTLYAGTTASYTQATGTQGTTGTVSGVATTDASTYTSAAPLSVSGSISNPSTGKISDYVVVQAKVGTGAVAGPLSSETLTFGYDET